MEPCICLCIDLAGFGCFPWGLCVDVDLIDRLKTTKVASLFYLGPPITMLMAWLAFGDKVALIDVFGFNPCLRGCF